MNESSGKFDSRLARFNEDQMNQNVRWHHKIMCQLPLPKGIRFAMTLDRRSLRALAEDFAKEFNLDGISEEKFEIAERLDSGHGQGWYAIALYNFFGHRRIDFLAYVNGRYGKGMPFGTGPGLGVIIKSLWSRDAKLRLKEEEELYQELKLIHDAGLRTAGIRK